jgi:hypothetical protein
MPVCDQLLPARVEQPVVGAVDPVLVPRVRAVVREEPGGDRGHEDLLRIERDEDSVAVKGDVVVARGPSAVPLRLERVSQRSGTSFIRPHMEDTVYGVPLGQGARVNEERWNEQVLDADTATQRERPSGVGVTLSKVAVLAGERGRQGLAVEAKLAGVSRIGVQVVADGRSVARHRRHIEREKELETRPGRSCGIIRV